VPTTIADKLGTAISRAPFIIIIISFSQRGCYYCVAGQSATIRFGRGRRPRGPTYARGTIRSLFEDQEQATQRTAYDVATRPPCRNLFRDAHFEIIQFVCAVNQFIFSLSGQGSFFVYRFTFSFAFSFAFSFTFGFRFFLSRFI
jgi:hypothetical protein